MHIPTEPGATNWRTVYATVKDRNQDDLRIGAALHKDDTEGRVITVWATRGGILGCIRLDDLEDSKLTSKTLADYFAARNKG